VNRSPLGRAAIAGGAFVLVGGMIAHGQPPSPPRGGTGAPTVIGSPVRETPPSAERFLPPSLVPPPSLPADPEWTQPGPFSPGPHTLAPFPPHQPAPLLPHQPGPASQPGRFVVLNHDLRIPRDAGEADGTGAWGEATLLFDTATGDVSYLVHRGGALSWQRIAPSPHGHAPLPGQPPRTLPFPDQPPRPSEPHDPPPSVPYPVLPPTQSRVPTPPSAGPSIAERPVAGGGAADDPFGNPLVDAPGFRDGVVATDRVRESRRVSEEVFVEMARDAGTVILDCRSREKYDRLHVRGAVNLPFPDITAGELERVIPSKETRILIYCNNNIADEPAAFPEKVARAALNLHSFATLREYGYENVFELGDLVERARSAISFEGTAAEPGVRN